MPWVEGAEKVVDLKRDFDLAFEDAWKKLVELDPKDVARKSEVGYDSGTGTFSVKFFGKEYHVKPEDRSVLTADGERTNPFYAFLILHYLVGAKDIPPKNELISFRELYGGDVYYQAFRNRAIEVVRRRFESNPEKLIDKGLEMGGEEASIGDFSVRIDVLPKIPITIVLWVGDEEVPTNANILFDKTAGQFLHTEDLAAICEELARILSA
jgi:hypothetical protein